MEHIIEIEHLSKSFGEVKAVQDLSFQVRKGELFAFLGVNGAGKSTTISVICGQLSKDSGSVTVCGENTDKGMEKICRKIGVVFQNSVLDKELTARENLQNRAALYGIKGKDCAKRISELAKLLDFEKFINNEEIDNGGDCFVDEMNIFCKQVSDVLGYKISVREKKPRVEMMDTTEEDTPVNDTEEGEEQ